MCCIFGPALHDCPEKGITHNSFSNIQIWIESHLPDFETFAANNLSLMAKAEIPVKNVLLNAVLLSFSLRWRKRKKEGITNSHNAAKQKCHCMNTNVISKEN